jgi:hypothetical protein
MARRILGAILLAVSLVTPATGGKARLPALASHTATYDFYLGGIWAGEMTLDADFGGEFGAMTYRAGVTGRTTGLVSLFVLFVAAGVEAETIGRIDANGLSPRRFTADAFERKRRQMVDISYADGSVASVRAEPAYRIRPWSISAEDQPGIPDPLSAAFAAFLPAAADAICGQTANVFDGERRWAVEIGPPQTATGDGRIRCDSVYVRIAGFKPKLMDARARRPFALFLEQRGDGLFHVVRAAGRTSFGLAVLLLRQ